MADGSSGSLTLTLSAFDVGGEYLSITEVELIDDTVTGEVTLTLDLNGYGDFASGGNENIGIVTDFMGGPGDIMNLAFPIAGNNGACNFEQSSYFIDETGITGQNQAFDNIFTFTLRESAIPEPSIPALLGLGTFAVMVRRRR